MYRSYILKIVKIVFIYIVLSIAFYFIARRGFRFQPVSTKLQQPEAILDELVKGMKWKIAEQYSSMHNYIADTANGLILRKGAVSALKDEPVIIPINMKDGVILGVGKGNDDWNYSAPHGAGRILKREEVKQKYTVSAFRSVMKGIYSSNINKGTLDEAPFAYRRLEEIKGAIEDSVEIKTVLKPVYNYKAGRL